MSRKKRRKVLPFETAMRNAVMQFMEAEQRLLNEGKLGKVASVRSDTHALQVHESPEKAIEYMQAVFKEPHDGLPKDVFTFVIGQYIVPDLVRDIVEKMHQLHTPRTSETLH